MTIRAILTQAEPAGVRAARRPSLLFGFFALFVVLSGIDLVQTVYAFTLLPAGAVYEQMAGGRLALALAGPAGLVAAKVLGAIVIAAVAAFFARSPWRAGWPIACAIVLAAVFEHVVAVVNNLLVLSVLAR